MFLSSGILLVVTHHGAAGLFFIITSQLLSDWSTGRDEVVSVEVYWPDGRSMARALQEGEMNSSLEITYPREGEQFVLTSDSQVRTHTHTHTHTHI